MRSSYHEAGMAVARTLMMELGTSARSRLSSLSVVSVLEAVAVESAGAGAARAVVARKRVARILYCMIKRVWEYRDMN